MRRVLFGSFVGTILLACVVFRAEADSKTAKRVSGEVVVVLAKEKVGVIDPTLKPIRALQRPPFNRFRTMRVVKRKKLSFKSTKASSVGLPNGRTIRVQLGRRMPDGRFQVKTSINKPGKKDYLPLLQVIAAAGDPFFVAGQRYQDGTLVVGVTIGTKPKVRRKTP